MKSDKVVRHWLSELDASKSHTSQWRERAKKIIKRYRDERETGRDEEIRYNILYANTQVMKGVMYQQTPTPDVRRRYRDEDPVGRIAADILNKALAYSIDSYDFDNTMDDVVLDRVLVGMGQARVRYIPKIAQMEREIESQPMDYDGDDPIWPPESYEKDGVRMQTETYDKVVYEEARCEYVPWDGFRWSPAPRWNKVRWVAFRELLSRQELIKQFGKEKGALVKLNWSPEMMDDNASDEEKEKKQRAEVWSVWNKTDRKVYVICGGYDKEPLSIIADPLGLEGFFPCPEPLLGITTNDTIVPVPDFCQYQDQAQELDRITDRINVLIDALRRRGVYDATITELAEIANAEDNQFIPVQNMAGLMERGGFDNVLMEMSIEKTASVVLGLYQDREQIKTTIYEITGLSDIVRGSSQKEETATAQQIKAQYSNVRVGPQQKAVQRFARDILRLKAEIISEHFSPETLSLMTGVQLPTQEEAMLAQMQGQDIGPTWEQVMELLQNDKLRSFRIDIETDSTIAPDLEADRAAMAEMLQAVSTFTQSVAPVVQGGIMSAEAAKSLMMGFIRKLKLSKEVEAVMEEEAERGAEQQIPPEIQQQMQEMQAQLEQADVAKTQLEQQKAQADVQLEQAKLQLQQQLETAQLQIEKARDDGKSQVEIAKLQAQAQTEQLKAQTQLQVAEINRQKDLEIASMRFTMDQQKLEHDAARADMERERNQKDEGESREKSEKSDEMLGSALGAIVKSVSGGKKVIRDKNGTITGVEPNE